MAKKGFTLVIQSNDNGKGKEVFIIKSDSLRSEKFRGKVKEILEKELDKMELCFAREHTGLQSW